jgi:hypothetical protein
LWSVGDSAGGLLLAKGLLLLAKGLLLLAC